jgi:hypothetical protein
MVGPESFEKGPLKDRHVPIPWSIFWIWPYFRVRPEADRMAASINPKSGTKHPKGWVHCGHDHCIDQLIGGWFVRWKEMVVYFVWKENDNQQRPERGEEQRRWKCDVGNVGSECGNNMVFRVTSPEFKTTLVLEITLLVLVLVSTCPVVVLVIQLLAYCCGGNAGTAAPGAEPPPELRGNVDVHGFWRRTDTGSLVIKHRINDGSLTFDGSEDGIGDGSLALDGINEGNFDSSLDSDGTDDHSPDFNGTVDDNVEGSLDFDGTEYDIIIAVFDRKPRPSSEPSSILKLETEPPAELLPEGTSSSPSNERSVMPSESHFRILLLPIFDHPYVGATDLLLD